MTFDRGAWRLRSRSKTYPADFRTGLINLHEAKKAARQWLKTNSESPVEKRKGGGTLERLTEVYAQAPKRASAGTAKVNISRLRSCCRLVLGRELHAVTCREIHPEFWEKYQREALAKHGHPFDYAKRYRENITINSAVASASALFTEAMIPRYKAAGLEVRPDAARFVSLPEPYVPPSKVDDAALVAAIRSLPHDALWLALSIARYTGLRKEEISALRGTWIEERDSGVEIVLHDRPENQWWTKTGKPYRALVIDPELADVLRRKMGKPEHVVELTVDRALWFTTEPQSWLKRHGVTARKPLHRLRGLYADHLAKLTRDAMAARLAGEKAAQTALGHTSLAMTKNHYLTQ